MNRAWLEVRVLHKAVEAVDIVSLELGSSDGSSLPPFSAGSHIDVELPNGLVRQYSLCNDATETHRYVIGVLLDPATRGGSRSVHHDIAEGATIRISEPRNHFQLAHAERSILFAGGIGVTPILCMAERLAATGAPFEMHYCARSRERMAFVDRVGQAAFSNCVSLHFDDGDAAQRLDAPAVLASPQPHTHLYVCGPKGFMDHVMGTARAAGWAEPNIHFEYFAGEAQDASADAAFQVRIASSGRVVDVAAGQTIVAALAASGIDVPVSCEQGVCGTCITGVLDGVPAHRDMYFTDVEKARNDQMTVCCSRSATPLLVLDL